MQEQPSHNQPTEQDRLEAQLREVVTAEKFFEQGTGQLWTQIVTEEINKAVTDITSDKYDKDHMGFLARKAEMNAYKMILRKMQIAASPIRKHKIHEKLEDIKNG